MAAVAQKVVLITGGSAGLGARCAHLLAPDFRIVINYASNKDRAESLVRDLSQIPCTHSQPSTPRFHIIQADVGHRAQINEMVQETVRTMGRLDVVISNAGWTKQTNFMNLNDNVVEDDWDKCFNMNVKAHIFLAHAAKEHLEQTEGSFISTASAAGVKPGGSSIAYAVTKAAQIYLTTTLAVVCAPKIKINSVSPGMMLTDWGVSLGEKKKQVAIEKTKLKRLAEVDDVAQQIRTLALSKSITGQNIVVSSGSTI